MKNKEKYMDTSKIKTVVTKKGYKIIVGDSVGTPTGRVVFPWLSKPQEGMTDPDTGKKGEDKYNVQLLIPKDGKFTKQFQKTLLSYVQQMALVFNKGKSTTINIASPFRDGDAKGDDKGTFWKGNWYIVAKNAKQPVVCSTKRVGKGWEEINPATIQGGMLVRLVVSPMITSTGLSYTLNYCQLVNDDGTRFAGGFDKKVMGGLLSGDEFDETDEVTAEDAADEALVEDEADDIEEAEGEALEEEEEEDEEEEERRTQTTPAPKKRGRPAGSTRKGKAALIDRL